MNYLFYKGKVHLFQVVAHLHPKEDHLHQAEMHIHLMAVHLHLVAVNLHLVEMFTSQVEANLHPVRCNLPLKEVHLQQAEDHRQLPKGTLYQKAHLPLRGTMSLLLASLLEEVHPQRVSWCQSPLCGAMEVSPVAHQEVIGNSLGEAGAAVLVRVRSTPAVSASAGQNVWYPVNRIMAGEEQCHPGTGKTCLNQSQIPLNPLFHMTQTKLTKHLIEC